MSSDGTTPPVRTGVWEPEPAKPRRPVAAGATDAGGTETVLTPAGMPPSVPPPSVPPRAKTPRAPVRSSTSSPRPLPRQTPAGQASPGAPAAPAAGQQASAAANGTGERRVRLVVARVDPWSALKFSFLLSVAAGIMLVVAAAAVWFVLDGLHVFTTINDMVAEITNSETFLNILEIFEFNRVISLATLIAVLDIVLWTALATIGAFLYNVVAALVGGLHVTLTDE